MKIYLQIMKKNALQNKKIGLSCFQRGARAPQIKTKKNRKDKTMGNFIETVNQVKQAAIQSAQASTADICISEKTLVGIVCRASKPITAKFGKYEGREIVKAQTYRILSVSANGKTASAWVHGGGRIEGSATKADWYLAETLNQIEQRSRQILGDDLYNLCESLLSSMNPNKAEWRRMLGELGEILMSIAAEFPAGEASENESISYTAKVYRRLSEAK